MLAEFSRNVGELLGLLLAGKEKESLIFFEREIKEMERIEIFKVGWARSAKTWSHEKLSLEREDKEKEVEKKGKEFFGKKFWEKPGV